MPRANKYRSARERPEWRHVYFIEAEGLGLVKIGCADDARKRIGDLQVGCPVNLILRGVQHVDDASGHERSLHRTFAHLRTRGEWFRIEGDLAALMDLLAAPEDDKVRICFKPKEPTGGATVYWDAGESVDSYVDRVCRVANAMYPGMIDTTPVH